jgi:threonyl-tRNA synthetase
MFITKSEKRDYALKPMNCPGHILIFKQNIKSYRDLPLRYGEFGQCHRDEPSGGLHGIMRVRGFTQDDGHIFCSESMILEECKAFTQHLQKVYHDFGFQEIIYKVATRPEKRIGDDALWEQAEQALIQSLKVTNCQFTVSAGEGAFYGPKIEYTLKDAIGREWQCGTIQVDFFMPERLGAQYIDEEGTRRYPVLLHRAIVGSLERFIGILVEQYRGAFPLWLAPVQIAILNITDAQSEYVQHIAQLLQDQNFRIVTDLRNEKITYKIREQSLQKLPYILVIGQREAETKTVSVRKHGDKNSTTMSIEDFIRKIRLQVTEKM